MLSTTQTRLSSGKKVNSALDNPSNYFTAQGLSSRSSSLSGLLDAVSTASRRSRRPIPVSPSCRA
ncbi:hypothetical protein [Methylobacterium currus]|uniref:flagellin N-terminal helical domain-containing protein n=1 Tax=Methylobacterium currus TaxID=2051553 RepID=UPI003B838A8E